MTQEVRNMTRVLAIVTMLTTCTLALGTYMVMASEMRGDTLVASLF